MSADVMEDHPHKKKISSRSYDEDDLDGLNELEGIDPIPAESNHMHNGASDGQMFASTSMQPPPSSQSQMNPSHAHNIQNFPSSGPPSSQNSVLQELLLSNTSSNMSSPRNQQQYNNSYRPIGRSPMTGGAGGTMVSPPSGQPRPMNPHGQPVRQQGPPGGPQVQQQPNQGYQTYQMAPDQQHHQNFSFQPGAQMMRQGMARPPGNQQGQMIRMVNGNPVRKDQMPIRPMMPNGNMMQRMVVQPNAQFDQGFVNGMQNGGPTTSRPQSVNVSDQQQGSYHVISNGCVIQNVNHQQPRPGNFHHGPIPNVQGGHGQQVFYFRQDHVPQGPGGHQMVGQGGPGPMNGNHMNGNTRPPGHVPQQLPPNNIQPPNQRMPQPPQQPPPNLVPNQPPPMSDPQSQGPQSIGAPSMPPQSAGTPNYSTQDPEKRRLIQQQLVLLLHAHKCQQRERGDGSGRNSCNLPHCFTMKGVLEHMTGCQNGRQCNYPHCASSRQIIAHWKNCIKDDCPVCKPLKCFNKNTPQQGSFGSPQPSGSSDYDNPMMDPFRSPNPPNRAASGPLSSSGMSNQHTRNAQQTAATLGLGGPMSTDSIGSLPAPDPPAQSKEWHAHIGKDLRNHLVGKLVKAIFPAPDPAAMQDQRIKDLISYARKVEKEMFEIASDREEYYHLLAEKIYKIQKELQEKKNRRLEQSHQQRDPISNLPSAASIKADIQQDISRNLPQHQIGSDLEMADIKPDIKSEIKPKVEPEEKKDESDSKPPPEDVKPVKKEVVEDVSKDPVSFNSDNLRKLLLPVWKAVDAIEEAGPFRIPVNPEALQIPDYFDVIKTPMDLSTIREKLDSFAYADPRSFCADMWQMFDNAWLYNRKNSKVYKFCTKLSEVFVEHMNPVMEKLGYCCSNKYNFTPLALFCFGQSMCIIARDQQYYVYEASSSKYGVNVSEKYIYCQKCFEQLPETGINLNENPNEPPNYAAKDKFVLMKNDQIDAEPFETCKICTREWHRICANYNKKVFPEGFVCETCRKTKNLSKPDNRFTAKKLPHCKLSLHIENRVNNYIRKKCRDPKDKHEVVIRVLCSTDKEVEVKPLMKNKYSNQGFPDKFPYRTKAVFAFEIVDGVEICFFGLHVQEYGSECKEPNTRRVYIAYLDSVHFFQPRELRTDVYHEILLSYLEYVRNLGYTMAHIWACPPSEGDDYIFHCHPPEQKIPKPKRLQDWYKKMLDKGISDGIVCEYKDIHKQAKDDNLMSPMGLPYFEGDFWPNIIEDCIREAEKEEAERKQADDLIDDEDDIFTLDDAKAKKSIVAGQPNKKAKALKKSSSTAKKKKGPGSGNEVTDKLYNMLEKHKEVFFTIRLHSRQSELSITKKIEDPDPLMPSDLMDGRDTFLTRAREEHWEFSSLRRAKYSTLCFCHALHTQENKDMNYTCNTCHGNACWHCSSCEDFDLCNTCYQNTNHEHKLEKINTLIEVDKSADSTNTRNESIQRCIQSLVHACQCRDANCRKVTCHKMKKVVQHTKLCKKRQHTNCPVCKQLIALCCYHAKHCTVKKCAVPFCSNIRQKLQEQKRLQNRRADMLMRRRMELLQAGQAGGASQVQQPPPQPPPSNVPSKPMTAGSKPNRTHMAGKKPNTPNTGYQMNNPHGGQGNYAQGQQMNQPQYQQHPQMRMMQNPQMVQQQRQMSQNPQQQTMYMQNQHGQNQQQFVRQQSQQGYQGQGQQVPHMQQGGNMQKRPGQGPVVQGMQPNQNMVRQQTQSDAVHQETSLGSQMAPGNSLNNLRSGKHFPDPQIQTIVERLKVAKSGEEREMVYRDLKKIPHLFSAFLKHPESQFYK